MGMIGQLHVPVALPPGKNFVTHLMGCWVAPKGGLDDLKY